MTVISLAHARFAHMVTKGECGLAIGLIDKFPPNFPKEFKAIHMQWDTVWVYTLCRT